MRKYFILLLIAVFASLGVISKPATSRNQTSLSAPTATPVDDSEPLLLLSTREIIIPCPPGFLTRGECPDGQVILVKTGALNPIEKKNVYKYTVSGGRIVGEGQNVRWDLSGVRPGTYTIKTTISDGEKTKEATETITVRECDCGGDCFCPTLSVTGTRSDINAEIINFTANVSGGTGGDITYNWTVSQGEIISGQGTATISVKIDNGLKGAVKASVEIGELCNDCIKTASATVRITK